MIFFSFSLKPTLTTIHHISGIPDSFVLAHSNCSNRRRSNRTIGFLLSFREKGEKEFKQ